MPRRIVKKHCPCESVLQPKAASFLVSLAVLAFLSRLAQLVDPYLQLVGEALPGNWDLREEGLRSLHVRFTVGLGEKQNEDDEAESVLLASGDALIFGGPCRYVMHCVKRIHNPDSAPEWLQSPHPLAGGRLNFTFRYAPEAFGREGEYR